MKRALKKIAGALNALQGAHDEMESILAGNYVVAPKERNPRQVRAPQNTMPKASEDPPLKKQRRSKKTAE